MDTDDLSEEAYSGILEEAESFNHDLTLQFGLISDECDSEAEYLEKAIELINGIRKCSNEDLKEIFFGELPNKKLLYSTLDKIIKNIEEVKKIPEAQRTHLF
jgi:hypothetical protein